MLSEQVRNLSRIISFDSESIEVLHLTRSVYGLFEMKRFLLWILVIVAAGSPTTFAQAAVPTQPNVRPIALDRGAAGLWQTLQALHTRASLIHFTAHPDDEDGGMLAYESRAAGVDATLFTLNRGEGGQNEMSSDFWDELGVLRTEELLAADRYYGVHQYWSRVADFGFTKTKEEALQRWGYDRVLYDAVRVVRLTRPLVVTSVFAGNVSDGHGQHQVAGQMAQEVFRAAADPTVFPDQIRAGLRLWAPLKVYVRLPFATITDKGIYDYATGNWAPVRFQNYVDDSWIEGRPSATVSIPEGKQLPYIGLSSIQVGRMGLDQQKSQNGGIAIPAAGPWASNYHRYASRVPATAEEKTFFDGIDTSLMGIAAYAPPAQAAGIRQQLNTINTLVERAMHEFSIADPQAIAPLLAQGAGATNALVEEIQHAVSLPEDARYNMLHELTTKQRQFNQALIQALGLSLQATVSDSLTAVIPGQRFSVQVHVANQGSEAVQMDHVYLRSEPKPDWNTDLLSALPKELAAGQATDVAFRVTAAMDAAITQPYFSRPSIEQPYYDISDIAYENRSWMPYPLAAEVTFTYRGIPVRLNQVVQTTQREQGIGPVENPLVVAPAISISVTPSAGIVPLTRHSFPLSVMVRSNVPGSAHGEVTLDLPSGWSSIPAQASFSMQRSGEEQSMAFTVVPRNIATRPYRITAAAMDEEGKRYTSGVTMISYPGLRPYPYSRPAMYRTSGVDVRIPTGLKVGYVEGTGDDMPRCLEDLGVHVDLLSAQDLATSDLSRYNAILLGVRAYAVRPELKTFHVRLLEYVRQGGTLIVQYNLTDFDADYAPYRLELGKSPEKVIEETAPVVLLDANSPVFNWPNRISEKDFSGWVEERGHGFMQTWDPHFTALTETHDSGQSPQKGGLLVAPYGKGFYVYEGFALYRQLPEGVPGAFRILANLISLSSQPATH